MSKLKYIFALLVVVCLLSCNKSTSPEKLELAGNWMMTESTDNYNKNSFEQYSISNPSYINLTFDDSNNISITNQNDLLYTGTFSLTDNQKEILVLENKNQILYKFTVVSYSKNKLKVAYKTSNGTYIHLFERK